MFSLICVWINGAVNNREAGDLRHYRGHYDVIVMYQFAILPTLKPSFVIYIYYGICRGIYLNYQSSMGVELLPGHQGEDQMKLLNISHGINSYETYPP